jgi:hypothetical protein
MKIRTQLKLYLVGLLILCPNILWAKHVSVETARKVAVNSMNKNNEIKALRHGQKGVSKKITLGEATHSYTAKKKDISVYYVFNFSTEGWTIISADDAACPVIAYCESGFYDPNVSNQPPAFIDWMDNAASQIADAALQDLKARPKDALEWKKLSAEPDNFVPDFGGLALTSFVDPLIQSHWGQGGPQEGWPWNTQDYNKYCPWEYTDWTHLYRYICPTGCVATAMAQIMKYWQWPPSGNGSHGYDPPTYTCTHECSGFGWRYVNFANQSYNWSDSSMPLNGPSDAIDILMRDIGVAVEMDYTPSGSGAGTSITATAFHNYFRYTDRDVVYKDPCDEPGWIAALRADLNDGRPIFYRGDPNGPSGHAFVCDGYDLSNNFHFNWGWDGSYDGWFTLNDLTPSSYNFSYSQGAILGLEPEPYSETYVDDDYTSGNCGGHTWNVDAFNTIQAAINSVLSEGIIYVAAGTYVEAIDLKGKEIHLYGISGPSSTIINGNGADHVVKCVTSEDANTIIEGFTITGGNANGSANLDKCGGGMCNSYSSPTVINCRFISNAALLHGGGMHNEHASPTVINCSFSGNTSVAHGGGLMDNYNSTYSNIINCLFTGNTAGGGGGGYCDSGGYSKIFNCTFSGNSASLGGGIYSYYGGTHLYNCIVWGNNPTEIVYDTISVSATYSDIKGGYSGTGNINIDPCFINAGSNDLHLRPYSPCLDAGNNAAVPSGITTDLNGLSRFVDSCRNDTGSGTPPIVDMGAYEFQHTWYRQQNLLVNPGFETGNATGWITNWGWNLTATAQQVHSGSYSGLASGRTASWQGAWQSVMGLMDDGKTYRISGWVRLQNADSNHVALTVSQTDSGGAHYYGIDNATAYNDRWTLLDGTFVLNVNGSLTDLHIYFEGPPAGVNFYVDDASVTEVKGDLSHNGGVDFFDFGIFAQYYEFDCAAQDCGSANLEDCDDTVNELDLAILVRDWLVGI